MPLNIDINFRWSKKPAGENKKKTSETNAKTKASSSSSSSSSPSKTKSKLTISEAKKTEPPKALEPENAVLRNLIIMRHGERMDRVFPDWMNLATTTGAYRRYDTNQPADIPSRAGGLSSFKQDTPITVTGRMQAQLIGQAIQKLPYTVNTIYCSPALRCVQTATAIHTELSKSNKDFSKIRVEPALFDWLGWYVDCPPTWIRAKELRDEGIPVDAFYKPLATADQLFHHGRREDQTAFNRRCQKTIRRILDLTQGVVLIITHAANVDACARGALALPRSRLAVTALDALHHKFPYCCTVCLEQAQDASGKRQWRIATPLPAITGLGYSTKVDMEFLLRQN